jgi:hypothetical protein
MPPVRVNVMSILAVPPQTDCEPWPRTTALIFPLFLLTCLTTLYYCIFSIPISSFFNVDQNFDLRPGCIVRDLKLNRPIFAPTAAYGHFGRMEPNFSWEEPKNLA